MTEICTDGSRKYYDDQNKNRIYITNNDGKKLWFTNDFVDISYFSKNSVASALSNLFPYNFVFRCYNVKSIEGVLQGLKQEDSNVQQLIFNYAGKDAYHTRASSFIDDWRTDGIIYFQGNPIDRFDMEYQELLNELYLSLCQNPLFVKALMFTGKRELLHSEGEMDPSETILTPVEYIDRLKIIRDSFANNKDPRPRLETLSERIVEEYYQKCYSNR